MPPLASVHAPRPVVPPFAPRGLQGIAQHAADSRPHPVAAHHALSTGKTEVIGSFSGAGDGLQGKIAATTKKDNGLVKALHEALEHLIEDGTYGQVLRRWGLSDEAVPASEVNPRGLPKSS